MQAFAGRAVLCRGGVQKQAALDDCSRPRLGTGCHCMDSVASDTASRTAAPTARAAERGCRRSPRRQPVKRSERDPFARWYAPGFRDAVGLVDTKARSADCRCTSRNRRRHESILLAGWRMGSIHSTRELEEDFRSGRPCDCSLPIGGLIEWRQLG